MIPIKIGKRLSILKEKVVYALILLSIKMLDKKMDSIDSSLSYVITSLKHELYTKQIVMQNEIWKQLIGQKQINWITRIY